MFWLSETTSTSDCTGVIQRCNVKQNGQNYRRLRAQNLPQPAFINFEKTSQAKMAQITNTLAACMRPVLSGNPRILYHCEL